MTQLAQCRTVSPFYVHLLCKIGPVEEFRLEVDLNISMLALCKNKWLQQSVVHLQGHA